MQTITISLYPDSEFFPINKLIYLMWLNYFLMFIYKSSMILLWIIIVTRKVSVNLWTIHIHPPWFWQKLHTQKVQRIRLCILPHILKLIKKNQTNKTKPKQTPQTKKPTQHSSFYWRTTLYYHCGYRWGWPRPTEHVQFSNLYVGADCSMTCGLTWAFLFGTLRVEHQKT